MRRRRYDSTRRCIWIPRWLSRGVYILFLVLIFFGVQFLVYTYFMRQGNFQEDIGRIESTLLSSFRMSSTSSKTRNAPSSGAKRGRSNEGGMQGAGVLNSEYREKEIGGNERMRRRKSEGLDDQDGEQSDDARKRRRDEERLLRELEEEERKEKLKQEKKRIEELTEPVADEVADEVNVVSGIDEEAVADQFDEELSNELIEEEQRGIGNEIEVVQGQEEQLEIDEEAIDNLELEDEEEVEINGNEELSEEITEEVSEDAIEEETRKLEIATEDLQWKAKEEREDRERRERWAREKEMEERMKRMEIHNHADEAPLLEAVASTDPVEMLQPVMCSECIKNASHDCEHPRVSYSVDLHYPIWLAKMPHFITPEHREDFLQLTHVEELMKAHDGENCRWAGCPKPPYLRERRLTLSDREFTKGQLVVVKDAVYGGKPRQGFGNGECEWPADYRWLTEFTDENVTDAFRFDKVALLIGPMAYTFHHFMDRLLPDIAQAWDMLVKDPQWVIARSSMADGIVKEMWELLERKMQRLGPGTSASGAAGVGKKERRSVALAPKMDEKVFAKEMLFACRVPRYHPYIWQKMQLLLDVDRSVPLESRSTIVYFSKGNRKITNEESLIAAIRSFIDRTNTASPPDTPELKLKVMSSSDRPNLEETRRFFNNEVKAVIAANGGALYNINFCAENTLVVELFPYRIDPRKGKRNGLAHPHAYWWQADLLGHRYWNVPVLVQQQESDAFAAPVANVIDILERELV